MMDRFKYNNSYNFDNKLFEMVCRYVIRLKPSIINNNSSISEQALQQDKENEEGKTDKTYNPDETDIETSFENISTSQNCDLELHRICT